MPPAMTGLEKVHAAFVSGAGEAGIRSVQMFLDGQEVTASAAVDSLRVAYSPGEKLAPGTHAAKVIVVDSLGRSFVKEWSFEVASPEKVEVIAFFSDALAIDLDPLPRRMFATTLRLAGTTLPGAEVSVRVGEDLATRVIAGSNGRFSAEVELARGQNELTIAATQLDNGDQGVELRRRIEQVALASIVPARPPTTWTGEHDAGRDVPVAQHLPPATITHEPVVVIHPPEAADPTLPRRPADERVATRVETAPVPEISFEIPGDGDDDDPPPPPVGEVVITKPTNGEGLRADHVTVLGRAPAGWHVIVLVDGDQRGSDTANPAGHFTMSRVELGSAGDHELVAEATSVEGQVLHSAAVAVHVAGPAALGASPLAGQRLSILSPARGTTTSRDTSLRVEGVAWDGAQVDIEVNGRVVVTEIAGINGRFVADVPLEAGSNLLVVEAGSQDGGRLERSQAFAITAQSAARPRQIAEAPIPIRGGPPRGFPTLPAGTHARP